MIKRASKVGSKNAVAPGDRYVKNCGNFAKISLEVDESQFMNSEAKGRVLPQTAGAFSIS